MKQEYDENQKKRSRKIPPRISDQVKANHFFECAWCCTKLIDKHHIKEFSKGGSHTIENLILLCPNCHRQVHDGQISEGDLLKRKSTHIKGDRRSGNMGFEMSEYVINIGGVTFLRVPTILAYKGESIISIIEKNKQLFLSTRFYNEHGNLIFWMSLNRYWAPANFNVHVGEKELIIINRNDANTNLAIWEEEGRINLMGKNYLGGMLINFNTSFLAIGNTIFQSYPVIDGEVGISI